MVSRLFLTLAFFASFSIRHGVLGQSNRANEFFTGFSKSLSVPGLTSLVIYVTTQETSAVSVRILDASDNLVAQKIVSRNSPAMFTIDNVMWTVTSYSDINKGLRIKADNDKKIAVYASNAAFTSAALFLVLPSQAYPAATEYTYIALSSTGHQNSTVLLVAGHNRTRVTVKPTSWITLPAAITGENDVIIEPNQSYTFMLQRMQSLLLESVEDLSGTQVTSDQPISVISGHQCGTVPANTGLCDQILEQIPPTITWGKVFMSLPFTQRLIGSVYRIVAAESDTDVSISCTNDQSITDNQQLTINRSGDSLIYNAMPKGMCTFVASKPVLVGQYSPSKGNEAVGTPLLMTLPPVEQYVVDDTVITPGSPISIASSHLNIITSSSCVTNSTPIIVGGAETPVTWTPLRTAEGVTLGYGTTLNINRSEIEVKLPTAVPMVVLAYGFSSRPESFGSLITTNLLQNTMFSTPVEFSRTGYNMSEQYGGSITLQRMPSLTNQTVMIRKCTGSSSQQGNWADSLSDFPILFPSGVTSMVVPLPITDDDEVQGTECTCLEIVPSCLDTHNLNPSVSHTSVCVEDNDGVSVALSRVTVVDDQLELIIDVSDYRGDVPITLELFPVVQRDLSNEGSRGKRQTQVDQNNTEQLAPLTLCITKYLTQAVLRRQLSAGEQIVQDASFGLKLTSTLNVTVNGNNMINLTTQATPTPTPAPAGFVPNDLFYYIVIGILGFLAILFFMLFLCVSVCCCACRHRGEYDITSQTPDLEKIAPATSLPSMSSYNFSSQQMLNMQTDGRSRQQHLASSDLSLDRYPPRDSTV